ncbi:hypothetical protein ACF08M_38830 [Streptomyces sp. NPDC015032]|uniref:hypothetical protein n=1 Tax=Streptomyces sp. NPDC015032 TaxID=3364937 RepID=UPI003700FF7C
MSQQEQPWQPGPNDLPFTTHLINPHGDRHLGFNDDEGRFYRLWQHRQPEPPHTGDAILLRRRPDHQVRHDLGYAPCSRPAQRRPGR